jgi:adenylyltransferase/sulfurtransferase
VIASGSTVGEVLASLTTQFPDLRKQIFTDEGKVRSFVNVYLNDEDIRYLGKDATPAADGDTLSLVPSIAGGKWDRGSAGRQGTDHKKQWSVTRGDRR